MSIFRVCVSLVCVCVRRHKIFSSFFAYGRWRPTDHYSLFLYVGEKCESCVRGNWRLTNKVMYVGKIHFNDDVVLNVCESLKNFEFKFKTMFSRYLFAVVV